MKNHKIPPQALYKPPERRAAYSGSFAGCLKVQYARIQFEDGTIAGGEKLKEVYNISHQVFCVLQPVLENRRVVKNLLTLYTEELRNPGKSEDQDLLGIIDLDEDGIAEIVIENKYYEWEDYTIYTLQKADCKSF